ncbi:uncharacterized protein LOC119770777 [Culex quinquefasciatus]|uniref:uncharacterized protein LOC119770777 n=1 Tax=Culex quinquefasciatus TaxID=7176 RepID=UPI0018E356DD|nr:uncharacterized protein LOC119770777 [Culex quinquefasciatus]XP_039433758.1 uncharacterized protein LOC120416147 [Culex pipiens pallens]
MLSFTCWVLLILFSFHVSLGQRHWLYYSWSFQYLRPDVPTRAPLVTSRCAANETYRRVGRPCGKSCGTYGQLCAMKRINRCQCLVGFARNRSGACIYHKHCPVNLQDAEFLEFV